MVNLQFCILTGLKATGGSENGKYWVNSNDSFVVCACVQGGDLGEGY